MSVHHQTPTTRMGVCKNALVLHFPILLFGWFFLGMALCGLLAPEERVLELNSALIGQGWHLSLLALVFGGSVVIAYIVRLRRA